MNQNKLFAFLCIAFGMVACDLSTSSSSDKQEVDLYENLPECSAKKNVVGSNLIGKKFYVSEEESYYMCTENGWESSDSTVVEAPPTKVDDPKQYVVENATVMGTASVGGFFDISGTVILREIEYNAKEKSFKTTGVSFVDEISSVEGEFVIPKVSLYNSMAEIEVRGLYSNILTGEKSEDSLIVKVLCEMNGDDTITYNVGILSILETPRIKELVKKGYSFGAAKKQAEKEIWNAFGYTYSVKDEESLKAAEMAIAIMLLQENDESDFEESLTNVAEDIAEDGILDDVSIKTQMADFAFNLQNDKFIDEDFGGVRLSTSNFRKNYEKLSKSEAAPFESYLTKFWNNEYGLGVCTESRENIVLKNNSEDSDSTDAFFICKSQVWLIADTIHRDTVGLGNALDGEIQSGNFDDDNIYQYDTTGLGENNPTRWRLADTMVARLNLACTDYEEDEIKNRGYRKMFKKIDDDSVYVCNNRVWNKTDTTSYNINEEYGLFCDSLIKDTVVKMYNKKENTDSYYRCSEVVENIWGWSGVTETDYVTQGISCNDSLLAKGSDKKFYTCRDKENIRFRKATENEEKADLACNVYQLGKVIKIKNKDKVEIEYTCGKKDFANLLDTDEDGVDDSYGLITEVSALESSGYSAYMDDLDWFSATDLKF